MPFDYNSIDLPVKDIIPKVKEHLSKENTLIVSAPPGAGKSTLIPLALINEPWLNGKKTIMLEPRRLATKSIASRLATLYNCELGKEIGYRIRFDNKVSTNTQIEVITEGILTRMLQSDPTLANVGLIIFDEFHERSIHADVALALSRETQLRTRPDLRVLVMSATLNTPQLTDKLQTKAIESKGRQYPVEIIHLENQEEQFLPEMTSQTIVLAANEQKGDILVFLPGEAEIKKTEEILKNLLKGFAIQPLYGRLPFNKQTAAIRPNKQGKRKVVLATSIAETSLTIEGIKTVIDSGFGRAAKFDPNTGLSRLETIKITKDSADQRAGRAGRLSPGVCYRMWTESSHNHLGEHRVPEILETDLTPLVLDMTKWGIININQLTWLNPPPKASLLQAINTLKQLNAIEDGKISLHGEEMYKLPCHPRLAHMLVIANKEGNLHLATDVAALLEEKDPLPREAGIDINLRITALRRYRNEKNKGIKFQKIDKIASSYRKLFDIDAKNTPVDDYETGLLLAHAYPERIAFARPGNNAQFQLANGKYAMTSHKDDLADEAWLALAQMNAKKGLGHIFMASPLNPKDLAPLVKKEEVIRWDQEDGSIQATSEMRIGSIVLQSTVIDQPHDSFRKKAISDAIKADGEDILSFTKTVTKLQSIVLDLHKKNPQDNWPDFSTSTLLLTNEEWLSPYLTTNNSPKEIKELDLTTILYSLLTTIQLDIILKLT